MMYIVTEGQSDKAVIDEILTLLRPTADVKVIAAHGRSSASSIARSILASQGLPVALVLDADTTDPQQVAELQSNLEAVMGGGPHSMVSRVILFVPELEAIFFSDAHALEHAIGRSLSPEERVEARFRPRKILQDVLPFDRRRNYPETLRLLVHELGPDLISRAEPIRQLMSFVGSKVKANSA